MKRLSRSLLWIALCAGAVSSAWSEVTLDTDFTNAAAQREPLYNFWEVRNEIPAYPNVGAQKPPNPHTSNCIRLLGGWSTNGVANEAEDSCIWDEAQQKYVYRLDKIIRRIDGVLTDGFKIHQLVLDNPPWCFQRGLTFSSNPGPGEYDEADRISTYGNSMPPGEPAEWNAFIRAVMTKLVETYGLAQVEQWRFRVHTEADYHPHHWSGTKQDYFDHYANTVSAIHAVVPTAKVASHFLQASGQNRYGTEFVTWCDQNNVPVDYIGVTYYPFYNNANHVDLDRIFTRDFEPFLDAPGWQPHMRLEIPEFTLFTEKDDDGYNMPVETSHRDAFVAMLAKLLYEKSIINVHSWGDHTKDATYLALGGMLGKTRYENQSSGSPSNANNTIDGLFALDEGDGTSIDAVIFSYNPNPPYIADETVHLTLTVPVPPGTQYDYRIANIDESTNPHSQFVAAHPEAGEYESDGGWVIDRINPGSANKTDRNGNLKEILNSTGKSLWQSEQSTFPGHESLVWTNWQNVTTVANGGSGSTIQLTVPLASFSVQKMEFRTTAPPIDSTQKIIAGWDTWDSATTPSPSVAATGITASATASTGSGNWNNSDNDSEPGRGSSEDTTWGSFDGNGVAASSVTNIHGSNFTAANGVSDAELTLTITNNSGVPIELGSFHMDALAFRPNGPRAYALNVLAGSDITVGNVFTSTDDAITHLGGALSGHSQHDQIDLDLSGLPDSVLDAGGTAVIQIAFSSGTGSGGGHHLFLDNVAVSGTSATLTELQKWRQLHFGTTANSGPAADDFDANADGETNLLEFATGQNPHTSGLATTFLYGDTDALEFEYSRSKAAIADGAMFSVEWSDSLQPGSWSDEGVTKSLHSETSEAETIRASVPATDTGHRFYRLKIDL